MVLVIVTVCCTVQHTGLHATFQPPACVLACTSRDNLMNCFAFASGLVAFASGDGEHKMRAGDALPRPLIGNRAPHRGRGEWQDKEDICGEGKDAESSAASVLLALSEALAGNASGSGSEMWVSHESAPSASLAWDPEERCNLWYLDHVFTNMSRSTTGTSTVSVALGVNAAQGFGDEHSDLGM